MQVQLNYEAIEEIFKSVLVEDYKRLKKDIKELKRCHKGEYNQVEDLKDMKRVKKAYVEVIRYAFHEVEAMSILGKDYEK